MAKTPPVIIPVIVDATGVDRGIQDANRRLRYGMRGGAGTSTGFGTGGGQASGAGLGGGGGLATGIAAGAVAGLVASRVRRSGLSKAQTDYLVDRISTNPQSAVDYISQKFMGGRRNFPTGELLPRMSSIVRDAGVFGLLSNVSQPIARNLYNISAKAYQRGAIGREASASFGQMGRFAGYGTLAGIGDIGIAASYGLGGMVGSARRSAGRLPGMMAGIQNRPITGIPGRAMSMLGMGRFAALGPIGVGAGIVGAAVNFPQRLRESFSDLTQFEGTPNYNAARRIRAYYNAPERRRPGFFQEFGIGAAQVNQGGGSNIFSALGESIGGFARGIARYAGAALTNPFDFIAALGDPSSELNRRTQADQDIIVNEWKRLLY